MNLPKAIDRERYETELEKMRAKNSREHASKMQSEQARFEGYEQGVNDALSLLFNRELEATLQPAQTHYRTDLIDDIKAAKLCVRNENNSMQICANCPYCPENCCRRMFANALLRATGNHEE